MPTLIDTLLAAVLRIETAHGTHHEDTSQQFNRISQQLGEIMATLDDLKAAVTNETSVVKSAVTLINGFAAKLESAKADPAAIDALIAEVKGDADSLGAAVAANTPAAPLQTNTGTGDGTTTG